MKQQKKENDLTYFYLTAAMVLWGLSFVWSKQALMNFRPITLIFFRLIISFPILLLVSKLMKRLEKINRKDIPIFMLLALLEPLLYFLGESYGMLYVSSTVASIIIATIPLFTSFFAFILLKQKLQIRNYLGMIISFCGVLFVVFSDDISIAATWKGVLLILCAVISAIGYSFTIKRVSHKYNSMTIVSIQNMIGAIYFLPLFLIVDFKGLNVSSWTFNMFLPVLFLSIFASIFAYIGFIKGVKNIGVQRATVFTNFIPVFTALFALILLNESLTVFKIIGILLAVGGLILSQANSRIVKKKTDEILINELY